MKIALFEKASIRYDQLNESAIVLLIHVADNVLRTMRDDNIMNVIKFLYWQNLNKTLDKNFFNAVSHSAILDYKAGSYFMLNSNLPNFRDYQLLHA